MKQFCETSTIFELGNIQNEAILRDLLNSWTWQHPKRSKSARLPQFLNLTALKTKHFCKTSFKNGKLSAELTASYQCVLRFFHFMPLKYCACHEKLMPGHTKCCTCHAKSSSQNWRFDAPKCNLSQEICALTWPLSTSDEHMSLVLRLPRDMHLCRSSSNVPPLPSFWQLLQNRHVLLNFDQVHAQSLAPARRNVIWTSKSGPELRCFVQFDFEMWFAPQRRALFRHPNFQKWREHVVFCTFWLRHVLRATTACTFSTSEPPKVVRAWCALYILTSKCASRHNGVHFFDIATSKSGPRPPVFNIVTSKCASRHNGEHFFDISTSKSGPRPPVFNTFDIEMCFAPQRRALSQHLNFQKWSGAEVLCTVWLRNVLRATTACTFSTAELPKVVRTCGVLYILTSTCASRHNGVHFFDIWTSKSGPSMVCFVHFDFEMCFAPQRRPLFRHLNLQKWSEHGVLCTFWLRNVLRATTACTFFDISTSKSGSRPPVFNTFDFEMCFAPQRRALFRHLNFQVVRTWCVLYILTWKCASRHNDVQLFMAPVASWLRTRRFSEPTFWPSGATNHWKNTVFRDFPTFSRICIFCSYSFSSDLLSANLPLLSASALLCFSSLHIVGSLTSKLPSNSN